jgi:hypothetical protein
MDFAGQMGRAPFDQRDLPACFRAALLCTRILSRQRSLYHKLDRFLDASMTPGTVTYDGRLEIDRHCAALIEHHAGISTPDSA